MLARLYVDFNTMMMDPDEERVTICKKDSDRAIDRDAVAVLADGERNLLYDEEMEVEAVAELGEFPAGRFWLARPDWTTCRDIV
jgi:hypothetical protein